jgi:hypothetical protein
MGHLREKKGKKGKREKKREKREKREKRGKREPNWLSVDLSRYLEAIQTPGSCGGTKQVN